MNLPIAPGSYNIDTVHSQLGFAVKHLGISTVRGMFDRYSGALFVGSTLADTVVTIEAEMASVNSGNSMRDEHLHGADFFDVANHPQMTYRSTSVAESGSGYAMTGDLSIKGVTHPVTLQATFNGSGVFPMDHSTHHGFTATATISRSAFGVSYGVPLVSDDVVLTLDVQFISPAVDA
jgi:polyisoprenoid-binding protein YceI